MPAIKVTKRTIDLEGIISDRNPTLLRLIPKPLIRYLKRIIHEKEMNAGLYRLWETTDLEFIDGAMNVLEVEAEVIAKENLPESSRVLAVANHPLGGLDGLAVIHVLGRRYGDVRVPVNDLIMNLPNIRSLFVPINKHGSNRGNLPLLEEAFSGEEAILHFPAGLCSRRRGGKIRDLAWQKSFIVRARRYRRDVLPIYFEGRNSTFFYTLANLRRWLGIRANIEMVYLVDEMFKQRGRTLRMTVGKPIPWQTFDSRFGDWDWAARVKHHVYGLARQPYAEFAFGLEKTEAVR